MARAWPFEDVPEGGRTLRAPEDFVKWHGEGVEAVVIRIGLNDAQLVLVDGSGAWQRWVYHSMEDAVRVAGGLGIPVHENEFPEEMRVRMNARVRSPAEFESGAYPEQGRVMGVFPYKENRLRRRLKPGEK